MKRCAFVKYRVSVVKLYSSIGLTFYHSVPLRFFNITAMSGRTAPTVPNMMIDGSVMESAVNTANTIATSSADNGGAFFPVAGIVSLAALILYLAPPLKED